MGDLSWQDISSKAVWLTLDEPVMTWLKKISRGEERIISVEGILKRKVVFVFFNSSCQVRKLLVDSLAEFVLRQ